MTGYDLATFDVSAEVFEDSVLLGYDTILFGDFRRIRKIVAPVTCEPLNTYTSLPDD